LCFLGSVFNQVAVESQLANERIDLAQAERRRRAPFQVTPHETVFAHAQFERRRTGLVHGGRSVFLGQRKHAQDAAQRHRSFAVVHISAQRTDVPSGLLGSMQLLLRGRRDAFGQVLIFDAMAAALLANVLPQQPAGRWV
jgi:hypothetical protein